MSTRTRRRRTTAFTLIELIVAIGAVALIAVGIAAIFESIGRTVSGGRRVSVLNQYAALVERQMRADIEAMTREGVLLVRHQYADERNPVQTSVDDASPRPRRIDELLFFSRGLFSSARSPVIPGFNALSSEAMIYYGHGIRLHPLYDLSGKSIGGSSDPRYERPQVNDGSPARPYRDELALGKPDPTNPNRYAADWALLRKVTVLSPPTSTEQTTPSTNVLDDLGFQDATPIADSDIQIGGQPAAPSAFSTLATFFPSDYPFPGSDEYIRGYRGGDQDDRHPAITSGLVDVASTDLAEIRRTILDVDRYPWDIGGEAELFNRSNPGESLLNDRYNHNMSGAGSGLRFMQAWMDDLFPTDPIDPRDPDAVRRIRYEETLPDLVGTLSTYTDDNTERYRFIQNFRLADQRVLGSGVFVPRCTEFIVEYSFGQIVDDTASPYYGQLIWFGMDREVEIDGRQITVVLPYPYDTTSNNEARHYHMPYKKLDGTAGDRKLTPQLLYEVISGGEPDVLTAHFGYTDPTYVPSDPDVDPPTVPWPWPKLLRVTMTLADPSDPSIEQTFQFVFETPEGRAF